ncbi:MAG: hypothetical protein EXX96DRAFT_606958 [Benjaminiella poitrasii]|nr:MAG: hypothetical protein EXX96DRAFT_606958 [Benjaminiella poitrasii]
MTKCLWPAEGLCKAGDWPVQAAIDETWELSLLRQMPFVVRQLTCKSYYDNGGIKSFWSKDLKTFYLCLLLILISLLRQTRHIIHYVLYLALFENTIDRNTDSNIIPRFFFDLNHFIMF